MDGEADESTSRLLVIGSCKVPSLPQIILYLLRDLDLGISVLQKCLQVVPGLLDPALRSYLESPFYLLEKEPYGTQVHSDGICCVGLLLTFSLVRTKSGECRRE